ncbi:MAG: AgmX/PglI C-terminal domain-containing protein, partial [Myxococcota bacterium]
RNCYEEQLIQVPTLAGSLNANFSIETNGSVAQVQIDVPAPEMQNVADCLKDKIAGWWFPAARDVSEVRYPFNFTPGE